MYVSYSGRRIRISCPPTSCLMSSEEKHCVGFLTGLLAFFDCFDELLQLASTGDTGFLNPVVSYINEWNRIFNIEFENRWLLIDCQLSD